MSRPRRLFMAPLVAALLLIPATIAWSATSTLYKGKTSQHRKIRFLASATAIPANSFVFKIDEKCPDGHVLTETITISSAISISNSKFGGKFEPGQNPHGEKTKINGRFVGHRAKGTIAAKSYSPREQTLCSGNAKFNIKAH